MTNSVPDLKVRYIRRTRSTEAVVVQEFHCTLQTLPLAAHTLRRIPGIRWRVAGTLGTVRETLGSGAGALQTVRGTLESMTKTLRSGSATRHSRVWMRWSVRETLRSRAATVHSVRDVLGSVVGTLPGERPIHRRVGDTSDLFRGNAGRQGYPEGETWSRFQASIVLRPHTKGF